MRRLGWALVPLLALTSTATAGIAIRESQGRVDVAVAAAPLADVLDHLARQTGMKIVYEGPAPRQLVTLSLLGRSPAEAVASILEGQGLNYALVLDATATRVEKLLLSGPAAGATASSSPARRTPLSPVRPRYVPPESEPEPEPDELADEEAPSPEAGPPPAPGKPPTPPNAVPPTMGAPAPASGPVAPPPAPLFPSSPFNPAPVFPAPPVPQPTPETPPATEDPPPP